MEKTQGHVHEVSESELRQKLGADKRTSERHTAQLEVEVPLASWDQVKRVLTTNISQGGMLFTVPSPASIAATIDLVLTLPDGKKLTLPCDVRHVSLREGTRDFDVGVQFGTIEPELRQAFEDALKNL